MSVPRQSTAQSRGVAIGTLVEALTALQKRNSILDRRTENCYVSSSGVRASLLMELSQVGVEEANLSPVQDMAIDAVGMLFEFILDEPHLPQTMRRMLSALQAPMLKVALLDRRFFKDASHPARRLLTELAQASMVFTHEDSELEASRVGKVEDVIVRIVQTFGTGIEIFSEMLTEFRTFLDVEGQAQQSSQSNKDPRYVAETRAGSAIRSKLEGRVVPRTVRDLLDEGWRQVMVNIELRNGANSSEWGRASRLPEMLIWSVQPKSTEADRVRLKKNIPVLAKVLRDGLVAVGFSKQRTQTLLGELQQLQLQAMQGKTPVINRPDELTLEAKPEGDKKPQKPKNHAFMTEIEITPPKGY